ncbi:MAG: AAA family ATPase [Sulfolobales archaeon]
MSGGIIKAYEVIKVVDGKVSLIYGESGVGKTNIVLWILSNISTSTKGGVLYISTEGPLYSALLSRYVFSNNALFTEVYDSNSLLQLVFNIYKDMMRSLKAVAIDTINNFYRAEVGYEVNAGRVLNTILAFLSDMSVNYGVTCLLAAQVGGFDDEIKMSGFQMLKYWCDNVVRLDRLKGKVRRLFIEFPKEANLEVRYVVSNNGVEWLDDGS